MPRNGSGTYSLPEPAFVAGTQITSATMNSDLSDIATALTQSVSKDGQTAMTGPLNMGGNSITGVGAFSATSLSSSGVLNVTGLSTLTTLTVTGKSTLTGDVTASGKLDVTGAATVKSTLAVTGVVTAANGTTGSQVVNFSQFAQDSAGPGYITWPGGLILQWGPADVVTDGSGNATLNFALTFPSGCQSVVVANGNAAGSLSAVHLVGFSSSQAVVNCPTAISSAYRVAYFAIGK